MDPSVPATLIRDARRRAGLSQRDLAKRAGTAQSVVARIEAGTASPTWNSLTRLLEAAGFTASATLTPAPVLDSHMLEDVERILRLSPEERSAVARRKALHRDGSRRTVG